jgi:tRNA (guanine-N7-)-methyltransferase
MPGEHSPQSEQGLRPVSLFEYIPGDYFRLLDLADIFPRPAPLEIDLGCGDGSFLVELALANPDRNYLGVERLLGRVKCTSRKARRAQITNLRLLRIETAYAVRYLLPPGSVSRFYVMFPDPWPKRRHWPRRLIQPDFLESAANALAQDGDLCIKTDDVDYFKAITRTISASEVFLSHSWTESVPMTDFERHYTAEGRTFYALRLTKRPGSI